MLELDTKTKNYIFNNIINGCKHNNFDYVAKFDNNNNIIALKITNNNIIYNISDIGIMGVHLLVKEDYRSTSLWNIKKLLNFIKNNNLDDDTHTYYEKHFGRHHFIRIGSPYVESTDIKFYYDPDCRTVPEEITSSVPIWAFPTMVKMVQMGFIDEED